jgi:hypothetical protein
MNLLPKTEKEDLKKGLKLRLIVVTSFLLSASFLIGFVFLLPSYFLVSSYFSKANSAGDLLGSKDDDSVKKILNLPTEINSKLVFFQSNISSTSLADYFSKIVGYLPAGVRLNSVSFSKNKTNSKNGDALIVSGVAIDRDSLILFSTLLKKSNLFLTVDVPVSSLAKDKNLPFSMNIFTKD